jgi:hypothetical protein
MDNFFENCPPMMSDGGRHLGDFQSATRRNEHIKHVNGIYRDDDYRVHLQKNGLSYINNAWDNLKQTQSCRIKGQCIHNGPTRSTLEQFREERKRYENRNTDVCPQMADYKFTNQ